MEALNPFALVKASDYTDKQVNALWVELGAAIIDEVIEPRSTISKMILGGKGTGKTHLLRYYSYPVERLRDPNRSGVAILSEKKILAVYLRANGLDAARFEFPDEDSNKWQKTFALYLELSLVEAVLDALCDVHRTSRQESFQEKDFIDGVARLVTDPAVAGLASVHEFREWVISERRKIDSAVNNAAFTGVLEVRVPFSMGALSLKLGSCIERWCPALAGLSIIYMLDEIENFSEHQQEIVNTLIRYGEGKSTFRVGGRLYSIKTLATLPSGEENKEGSEFKRVNLDSILRGYKEYPEFAKKFVYKRLQSVGLIKPDDGLSLDAFNPKSMLQEVDSSSFYDDFLRPLAGSKDGAHDLFRAALAGGVKSDFFREEDVGDIFSILTEEFPLLLQKLNCLVFCKNAKRGADNIRVAREISECARAYLRGERGGSFSTAFDHYSADLLAQLCRYSRQSRLVPYAGFPTFIKMSSGNPRNLLIILGKVYENATFKGLGFSEGSRLSVELQARSAIEAAHFAHVQDTHFGSQSDSGREAASRLASLLRTARYALNIPEVSPLAVSFSEGDLSAEARRALVSALNYSFVFEVAKGRPDRNSKKVNRKIQLNPLLSPRWGLPISRRGDLSLSKEMVNAIFDTALQDEFDVLLRRAESRWNSPFSKSSTFEGQEELFA